MDNQQQVFGGEMGFGGDFDDMGEGLQDFFELGYGDPTIEDDRETIVDGWSGFSGDINVHPDQENVLLFPPGQEQDNEQFQYGEGEGEDEVEPFFLPTPFGGATFEFQNNAYVDDDDTATVIEGWSG